MKLKLGLVGPSGCGKTLIANILGNEMSIYISIGRPPYRPTNSVRIVEFSVPNIEIRKYSTELEVQIWEIGGNPRLKSIWPGVQSNLDGIILVYDTNNELHVRDMSALHMHFVTHSNLAPSQCLIIGNQFRGNRELGPAKIVGVGPRVRHFVVNVDDDPNYLRDEFKHYLTGVAQFTLDQEKNPQNSFMGSQVYKEGAGDAPTPRPQFSDYPHLQEATQPNSASHYQPYTEFHNARNSNKTRTKRDNHQILDDDEYENQCDTDGINPSHPIQTQTNVTGFRNIPRDEFSIHRKSKKN